MLTAGAAVVILHARPALERQAGHAPGVRVARTPGSAIRVTAFVVRRAVVIISRAATAPFGFVALPRGTRKSPTAPSIPAAVPPLARRAKTLLAQPRVLVARAGATVDVFDAAVVFREAADRAGIPWLKAGHALTATDTLAPLAATQRRADHATLPAVDMVLLHVPADPAARLPAIGADALPITTDVGGRAGVPAGAAVARVRREHAAAGITAGQVLGAGLGTPAAVRIVSGEIGADAPATTLPGRAAGAVAAVGVLRAGATGRAAAQGVVRDIKAGAVALGQPRAAGARAPAALAPAAGRASTTVPLDPLPAALADDTADTRHRLIRRPRQPVAQGERANDPENVTTREMVSEGAGEIIEVMGVHTITCRVRGRG